MKPTTRNNCIHINGNVLIQHICHKYFGLVKNQCNGTSSSETIIYNGENYGYGSYYTHCPDKNIIEDCAVIWRSYIVYNCTESLNDATEIIDNSGVNDICCQMGSQSYTFTCNSTTAFKNIYTQSGDCTGDYETFPFIGCHADKLLSYQMRYCSSTSKWFV